MIMFNFVINKPIGQLTNQHNTQCMHT